MKTLVKNRRSYKNRIESLDTDNKSDMMKDIDKEVKDTDKEGEDGSKIDDWDDMYMEVNENRSGSEDEDGEGINGNEDGGEVEGGNSGTEVDGEENGYEDDEEENGEGSAKQAGTKRKVRVCLFFHCSVLIASHDDRPRTTNQ
jgi:hypothetical protein